jgi:hypothetical protein
MLLPDLTLSARQTAPQLVLLVLWAALLFGGFALGGASSDRTRRMPTWTRLLSSLALVAIAWLDCALARELPVAGYALLIALGMSLGFLGDLCLAGALPISAQPVAGGILAFGLGHIAYLLAIFSVGNQYGLSAPVPRFGMLGVWIAIGLTGWYLVVLAGGSLTTLRLLALPYTLLLAGVTGGFFGLAIQAPAFVPAAIGAALFLISDLILAATLFPGKTFPLAGDLVWLTYGPAQALIVTSVAASLAVASPHIFASLATLPR